jgi:trans-2,3-dihydro-3-hydroxyanthranilate isomerase
LGVIPAGQPEVVFGLGVGPIRVRLRWEGTSLAFAEMEQLLPTFGEPVADRAAVAAALNLRTDDLLDLGTPVQAVSCGVPFLFVPVRTREAVDRAVVDAAAFGRLCRGLGLAEEVFIFSPETSGDAATVYSRMFAPGLGVTEDPATGAASGPLGCYLVRHGLVAKESAGDIVSLQGVKIHRPSRVHIAIGVDGDTITGVRVGGRAVVVGEGTLRW